jgi:hypothetical protein
MPRFRVLSQLSIPRATVSQVVWMVEITKADEVFGTQSQSTINK